MSSSSRSLIVVALLLLAAGITAAWNMSGDDAPPPPKPPVASTDGLPAAPTTLPNEFENTSPSVAYIGYQKCAECHAAENETYQRTTHSQAFSDLKPDDEPAGESFDHALSGRRYKVYRQDGEFRHRESIVDEKGEVAAVDRALRFLVGSGHHSRSYLADVEGHLVESPVTWYVQKNRWSVSPGYDQPTHPGFQRATGIGCLFCHLGRAEPKPTTLNRLTVHEQRIGCERCHGPGAAHQTKQLDAKTSSEAPEADATIVHPGRVDRQLAEDICSQCHLRGDAMVLVRGRELMDFRPGMRLTEVRVDYRLKSEQSSMKVVGHVEQMRLSKCYQKTDTMTCTTCHDPHASLSKEEQFQQYRATCLSCHQQQGCGLTEEERLKKSARDDCMSCHMPQTPTDIPHIAFTHHRVGIHDPNAKPPSDKPPADAVLEPYGDVSHLSEFDRCRNLGLAYLELAFRQQDENSSARFLDRAQKMLSELIAEGFRDPEISAGLARIHFQKRDAPGSLRHAREALKRPGLTVNGRINALLVAGEAELQSRNPLAAESRFRALTKIRMNSQDHISLAICNLEQGKTEPAIELVEKAIRLNPFRADAYHILGELHQRKGDSSQAQFFFDKAKRLGPRR